MAVLLRAHVIVLVTTGKFASASRPMREMMDTTPSRSSSSTRRCHGATERGAARPDGLPSRRRTKRRCDSSGPDRASIHGRLCVESRAPRAHRLFDQRGSFCQGSSCSQHADHENRRTRRYRPTLTVGSTRRSTEACGKDSSAPFCSTSSRVSREDPRPQPQGARRRLIDPIRLRPTRSVDCSQWRQRLSRGFARMWRRARRRRIAAWTSLRACPHT